MTSVLVTGSAGFLGRNLCPELEHRGFDVWSIDPLYKIAPCYFYSGPTISYDYVFHLAAGLTKVNVDTRGKMGIDAFADIELDMAMARYLEKYPPRKRAIWMSSSAVDAADYENYALVKYVGEKFAINLAKHGVPVSILRPFGGYGPGQSLSYPLPSIIQRARLMEDPLVVWGSLNTVRDWIYVDDLIRAMLMAMEDSWPIGEPVDIGTGIGISFGSLAQLCAHAFGYKPQIVADTSKPTASLYRVAKTSRARQLGFEHQIGLEEGLRRVIGLHER